MAQKTTPQSRVFGTDEHRLAGRIPLPQRIAGVFALEQTDGLRLAIHARTYALIAVIILLTTLIPGEAALYYAAMISIFILFGWLHFGLIKHGIVGPWAPYVFVAVDFALLGYTLFVPNPFADSDMPLQMALRQGLIVYYILLLSQTVMTYAPRLVLWAGGMGALSWAVGVGWIAALPDTVLANHDQTADTQARLAAALNPRYVDLNIHIQDIVVFVLVAIILSLSVARARRMVLDQARMQRERTNLARYFPPVMVDKLAGTDTPFSEIQARSAAIMFCDIVGFTALAEEKTPEELIEFLRRYHTIIEQVVFNHGGTLDKYLGDGMMSTFGTFGKDPDDIANAVGAGRELISEISAWNAERLEAAVPPVQLSVGIHYGDVVLSDIGSARRMEFAVLGDAVNVASRLEELTRTLDCDIVISDKLVEALKEEQGDKAQSLLDGFHEAGAYALRGRAEPLGLWIWSGPSPI